MAYRPPPYLNDTLRYGLLRFLSRCPAVSKESLLSKYPPKLKLRASGLVYQGSPENWKGYNSFFKTVFGKLLNIKQ